jgi:Ca2+-binding EF-hand superfamily protein
MSAEVLVTLDKVRAGLKKRGTKTIAGLGRTFR